MERHVKGGVFQEYVRMIKKFKQVDWSKYLTQEDLELAGQPILTSSWYPLEAYTRMGAAVFHEIAKGQVTAARFWGRCTMEGLVETYRDLIVDRADPGLSFEKFNRLYRRFLDFDAFEMERSAPCRARIYVSPEFGDLAVEGYSHQMLGLFERLIELSGAEVLRADFVEKKWKGYPRTVIEISWKMAESAGADSVAKAG